MQEAEKMRAIENAKPKKPRKYELGGDFYYRCYWASCDEPVSKWDNYCRHCGQRIDWEGED